MERVRSARRRIGSEEKWTESETWRWRGPPGCCLFPSRWWGVSRACVDHDWPRPSRHVSRRRQTQHYICSHLCKHYSGFIESGPAYASSIECVACSARRRKRVAYSFRSTPDSTWVRHGYSTGILNNCLQVLIQLYTTVISERRPDKASAFLQNNMA